LRVIEENHGAAHALDTDFKGDARTERGLFENERDEFPVERRSVADRTSLYVSREMQEFAGVRGAPLGSSEEIIRQGNRGYESGRGHVFTLPQNARDEASLRRLAQERRK
jgi:hypothetical protein